MSPHDPFPVRFGCLWFCVSLFRKDIARKGADTLPIFQSDSCASILVYFSNFPCRLSLQAFPLFIFLFYFFFIKFLLVTDNCLILFSAFHKILLRFFFIWILNNRGRPATPFWYVFWTSQMVNSPESQLLFLCNNDGDGNSFQRQNMRVVCFEWKTKKKAKDKYAIGNEKNMKATKPKRKKKKKGISCLPCRRQDVAVAPPVHVYLPFSTRHPCLSLSFSPQPPPRPTFY